MQEIPSYRPRQTAGTTSDAGGTKIALRTEEEQQAAAREREERERAQLEKEIHDRREARRKSLANRRVSFAAEATLHTFHEIEYPHDLTTSTDSTRRASSVASRSPSRRRQEHPSSDPPSTPPHRVPDHVADSPEDQRGSHQRRRRRSSGATSAYSQDESPASSVYDSDFDHADSISEVHGEELTDPSEDSDEDGTVMTVEAEEMTSTSMASGRSPPSPDSSGSLDENLRLAARRAANQHVDDDEGEEFIAGFAGWGRKNYSQQNASQGAAKEHSAQGSDAGAGADDQGSDMEMDMDMTNAVGGILRPPSASPSKDDDENEDMSMDVTKALGGIISKAKEFIRRKSTNPNSQQDPDENGEQTMDFTTVVGGIRRGGVSDDSQTDYDGNEDMSMEFTAVVGGLLSKGSSQSGAQDHQQQSSAAQEDNGEDEGIMMDMTVPVGRILPAQTEAGDDADHTVGMDMTVAMGGIIKPAPASTPEARSEGRKAMEREADQPDHSITTSAELVTSPKRPAPGAFDENATPGLSAFQGKGLRRTPPRALSPVARSPIQPSSSPVRMTPSPQRKATHADQSPTRTPPSRMDNEFSSPVRNISPPAKTTPRSPSRAKLFHQDPSTGLSTPRIVLTPQGRRLSGVGADRPGLGSPRVAEIFDRRESIAEAATDFVPSEPANPRRNVAFADPRVMEAEIDKERQDDQEASGTPGNRETTLNLREMIQGLSPKKNPLRGRKSLHVGSAIGLLGKRPAELDESDDESEDQDGVKRLKGHQGSPVKNIRLRSPPSKAETTTGRKLRASIMPAESANPDSGTPAVASSPQRETTPAVQGGSRDVGQEQTADTADLQQAVPPNEGEVQQEDDGERIHLQDFLNMTSIRFMELTTTKRRHTVVPGTARDSSGGDKDDLSLERCVVAGACTVPMLEMYQHVSHPAWRLVPYGASIWLTQCSHAAS